MCTTVCEFSAYNPAKLIILQGGTLILDESSDNENGFHSEHFVTSQETVRNNILHFIFLAIGFPSGRCSTKGKASIQEPDFTQQSTLSIRVFPPLMR